MRINGFQKTTLLDFPGKVACTVFTAGCNFRCPFCHNASLVLHMKDTECIPEEQILEQIKKRKNILEGVCVTGGEPLLQPDLPLFLEKIKELGLMIKLDTNGSNPERLKKLMDQKLIDAVAMDIKNCREKYSLSCGVSVDLEAIDQSIRLLMTSKLSYYEFRTTVVRELHTEEDLEKIARWICDTEHYFLQGFQDSGDLIAEGYSAYSSEEMNSLLLAVKRHIPTAKLRGIDTESN